MRMPAYRAKERLQNLQGNGCSCVRVCGYVVRLSCQKHLEFFLGTSLWRKKIYKNLLHFALTHQSGGKYRPHTPCSLCVECAWIHLPLCVLVCVSMCAHLCMHMSVFMWVCVHVHTHLWNQKHYLSHRHRNTQRANSPTKWQGWLRADHCSVWKTSQDVWCSRASV